MKAASRRTRSGQFEELEGNASPFDVVAVEGSLTPSGPEFNRTDLKDDQGSLT